MSIRQVAVLEDGTLVGTDGRKVYTGASRRIGYHELERRVVDEGEDGWKVYWHKPGDPDQVVCKGNFENWHLEDDPKGRVDPDGKPLQVPVGFDPENDPLAYPDDKPRYRTYIDRDGVQQEALREVTVYDWTEVG